MRKTTALAPLHTEFALLFMLLSSACTGVSSLPSGNENPTSGSGGSTGAPSGGTGTGAVNGGGTGSGSGSGSVSGTGAVAGTGSVVGTSGSTGTGTGTGSTSGTGGGVSIGTVVPTTQLDSGRVVLRRLNVAEYNQTIRDLLGTTTTPGAAFPGDNVQDGFDTLGEALHYTDLLTTQVEEATTTLVNELLARPATDPIRTKILVCTPTAANVSTCMTQILTPFMKNAYRRPVTTAEVADLVTLASTITQSSGDVMRGVNAAFKTVLLSPHFLFHVELGAPKVTTPSPLNDYELANRLSYFLWGSMPDAQLMLAADGTTLSPASAALSTQIDRMIADPKSQGLVNSFAGQWLWSRKVQDVSPDPMLFPTVDQALLDAIPQETSFFFKSLLTSGKPLSTLLLADYTFVNDRLAKHYGLPAAPKTFTQVTLPASSNRMGILTQETFLTTTSQPNRSSPVKRGSWILEQLLCDPPASPPPNVPVLPTFEVGSGLTGRQYLEAHVKVAYCAGCHTSIDPIGFTLENFDGVGTYRTTDNSQPIDASGVMPDGTKFNGPVEIAKWVANDPRFPRCVAKQMMTYAVGRSFDNPAALAYVAGLAESVGKNGTWSQMVHAVATSQAFLTRRGEGP